jgi:hypothetical protein
LDFAKIKQEHPIEKVAERLGLVLKPHGAAFRGKCPSGQGDERALVVTPAKGAWYSFAAQKGGDCLSLVAFVRNCSVRDAAAWVVGEAERPEKTANSEAEGFKELDYLIFDHEAVIALGLDPEDCKRIGMGWAPRGMMKNTLCIPVRDKTGKLLGYAGTTDVRLPTSWRF